MSELIRPVLKSAERDWVGEAIKALEGEMLALRDEAVSRAVAVSSHLQRNHAKTKLRPRVKTTNGSLVFSIIWRVMVFYDYGKRRAKVKELKKGRGYLMPRARLLWHCRGCAEWEAEYIWEAEEAFAGIRRRVSLLGKALALLRQLSLPEGRNGGLGGIEGIKERRSAVSPSA